MDEQELQRLLQQAQEEIRTLGSVSKDTADKIEEASDEYGKLKKVLKQQGEQFARTMVGITRTVGEGNTEFTVFNSVVDSVTGALTEMGKSIPLAGAAMVALGEGTKFLLGQLQATTKAFNQVGAAGLAGADGMTGLRDQFTTAGIDLQLYTKVITANSEALARFGGTADRGADRFAKALGQVNRDFGQQLMSLGNSFEDIAEQTAGYMALQTRLGRSQNMTQTQLAKGAFEYAKQLDELAKLTGQSKTQLQKQQDALLSDAKFRARTTQLESQGRGKLAEDFRKLSLLVPELGPGFTDIIAGGGAITTEAAKEVAQSTRFAAVEVVRSMEAGLIGPEEAARRLQAGSKQFVDANAGLIRFTGDIPGFTQNFAKVADLSVREFGRLGAAAATAATQMERPDALTGSAVAAQKEMMNLSVQINLLASNALPKAADAVTAFAEVLNKGLGAINKRLGTTLAVPQGGAAVTTEAPTESATAGFLERLFSSEFTVDNPRLRRERSEGGFADGGIARGPETGYTTTLHGAEAVVPLPDGNTIPVEIKGLASDQLVKEMATYLAKANRMYLETIPMSRGGSALEDVSTSADYMREVNRLFEMAAVRAAEATARGVDYREALVMKEVASRASLMKELAKGGITQGPSIAGEAGPEAVVPLPDGKSIPVDLKGLSGDALQIPVDLKGLSGDSLLDAIAKSLPAAPAQDPAKETFFAGMGTHGSIQMDNIYTDRKLTDMIMQRLGLDDLESKIAINKSGIGTNVSMFGGAGGLGQGVEMGSAIAGGVMRDDIADAVAKLVEGGEPLQEALKKTAADFNAAMQEFIKQQAGANEGEGMMNLMMQLVDLQRSQNATSKQILQVSAN